MFRRSYLWNPGCSTLRLYAPTGRSGKTNPPLASVTAERDSPVETFVTLTFADATTALAGSLTVPNKDAVSRTCAGAIARKARSKPENMPDFSPIPNMRYFVPACRGLSRLIGSVSTEWYAAQFRE